MAVESPDQPKVSLLKFFNRTAKVNQEGVISAKDKLVQIDGSLRKILSIREKGIDVTRIEEEQTQRQEKEKKLEAGKFFVRGVGKLANKIPGKNTVEKFLIFMAFGWIFNTFSKYFGELSGPLSKIISGSVTIIDAFSKIAVGIFDGFVTFVDIGYKTWDVIRGTEDSQKLQSAMNNVLLDIDSFFGGVLSLIGIVEQPPETPQPIPTPGIPGTPSAPGKPSAPGTPSAPGKPGVPSQTYTGGILPSTKIGSKAGDRVHPITGRVKFHAGNDYPMNSGTPITVLKGGKVTRSEVNGSMTSGYGNLIEIQHPDGSKSVYAHLNQRNVSTGDTIKPGTVIGTVGSTGGSTGPHLHFEYDNPNGQTERSWQTINSKADQIFRFGNVKPSQTYKLALKNGKEGVIVDGKWKPQKWTKQEKERYERVHGQQEQSTKASPAGGLSPIHKQALDILSKYESASSGGYNAVNQIGTKGGRGTLGFSGDFRNMKQHGGRPLTDMTIAEIMSLQKEKPGMSNQEWIRQGRLHAVGRYQFIGNTLPGVVARSGVPTSAKFTPEVQDKLAMQYLKEAGIGAWVGPSDKATKQERSIIEQARKTPFPMKGGGIIGDIPKQSNNINPSSVSSYPSYSESGIMMLIQPIIIEKPVPMSMNKSKTTFPVIGGVNSNSMSSLGG